MQPTQTSQPLRLPPQLASRLGRGCSTTSLGATLIPALNWLLLLKSVRQRPAHICNYLKAGVWSEFWRKEGIVITAWKDRKLLQLWKR